MPDQVEVPHEPPGRTPRENTIFCGPSAQARTLIREVETVATVPSTALITGETGTGKGAAARMIHSLSHRAELPFVHVDCAALPQELIESELYGHVRGAFTSADARRQGRFQVAANGTVFLDEVGELPLQAQGKLLRVLEDRAFEPVGSSAPIQMNARIVAATNRPLRQLVAAGRFRADLYYRLCVLQIEVPPLRERLQDIPDLTDFALSRIAASFGRPSPAQSAEFCDHLSQYCWPGNLRELFNVIESAVARTAPRRLRLRAADLSDLVHSLRHSDQLSHHASAVPRQDDVAETLVRTGGNVSRAARQLGLPRSTLRYRILRNGLAHLISRD